MFLFYCCSFFVFVCFYFGTQVLHSSIMNCSAEEHDKLFANIVISGGTAALPGFIEKLQTELVALAPSTSKVSITKSISTWFGGSLIACLPTSATQKYYIFQQEYDECGPGVVHLKSEFD